MPASSMSERSSTFSTGERGGLSSAGPAMTDPRIEAPAARPKAVEHGARWRRIPAPRRRPNGAPPGAPTRSDRRRRLVEDPAEALEVAEHGLRGVGVGHEVHVEERHLD